MLGVQGGRDWSALHGTQVSLVEPAAVGRRKEERDEGQKNQHISSTSAGLLVVLKKSLFPQPLCALQSLFSPTDFYIRSFVCLHFRSLPNYNIMRSTILTAALAALLPLASAADAVKGAAEGFAKGVTGGGNAAPVYPTSITELTNYLKDSSARVIVLTKTFDFTGSEGTASEQGCAPYGTGSACQVAINKDNWYACSLESSSNIIAS